MPYFISCKNENQKYVENQWYNVYERARRIKEKD
jgi:hypothetical protein